MAEHMGLAIIKSFFKINKYKIKMESLIDGPVNVITCDGRVVVVELKGSIIFYRFLKGHLGQF